MKKRAYKEYWQGLNEEGFSSTRDATIHYALASEYKFALAVSQMMIIVLICVISTTGVTFGQLFSWEYIIVSIVIGYFYYNAIKKRNTSRDAYEKMIANEESLQ